MAAFLWLVNFDPYSFGLCYYRMSFCTLSTNEKYRDNFDLGKE